MKTKVITTGYKYTDIDAFASGLALAQGLKLRGQKAMVVFPGPLNHSVSATIRNWNFEYETKPPVEIGEVVLVDVSKTDSLPDFVNYHNVVKIYDHHFGFEDYWKEKLGDNAKIEPLGAIATMIWEEIKNIPDISKIEKKYFNALYTAVVSNTLNFKAELTTDRDKKAFRELKDFVDLPKIGSKVIFMNKSARVLPI